LLLDALAYLPAKYRNRHQSIMHILETQMFSGIIQKRVFVN
jgi:hypothetical protein